MFDILLLTTTAGRRLYVERLLQVPTYHGLLEGVPTSARNERWIAGCLERVSQELHSGHAALVIPPVPQPIELPEQPRRLIERGGVRAEHIPTVTCMAVLESFEPTSAEPDEMHSSLGVLWFQEALAMPIDPAVEAALKAIDWDAHAWAWSP